MSAAIDYWEVSEEDDHHLVCPSCEGLESFETYEMYHQHYRRVHIRQEP